MHSEAQRHRRKITPFIKASCFAYIRKNYLIPDEASIDKILQLLQMMYATITIVIEDGQESLEFEKLRNTIQKLETEIRYQLISPPVKDE